MSQSAIIMMVLGLGLIWGGAVAAIMVALAVEKKNASKGETA